jgi:electron-transferring-flavoprotein dehydrogenase
MENIKVTDYSRVSTIVVGGGPAGLAAAITLKKLKPDADICVVDKAHAPGNHNLSGAAVEPEILEEFLDFAMPQWRQDESVQSVFERRIDKDLICFFLNEKHKISMSLPLKIANMLKLGLGSMVHKDDYMISISKLAELMCRIASDSGVEVIHGFSVRDIIYENGKASGVIIGEQGRSRDGEKQPNYLPPEKIYAESIVLAEGCDGLVTETFVEKAALARERYQLYSIGVKEVIRVNDEQYQAFGSGTCLHAMGYPIFSIIKGPRIFGGGVMYAMDKNHIAVGMITALDWKDCNFNPQDALTHFKNIPYVHQYIADGVVAEAGAKMIPEGGWLAVPRDPETGSIGKGNVILAGDSAGFVNMQKIKGIHNAIKSGMLAGKAIAEKYRQPASAASEYTKLVEESCLAKEMKTARNYRQTIAKFGMILGLPLSVIGNILPKWKIEPDYKAMRETKYRFKHYKEFDKDTFTALASTQHREEEPCHLQIKDPKICMEKCDPRFGSPCITFCPAGVYENIAGQTKPANPSNCLHCKTCQRKCPYDNIRWVTPEGGGGPRYTNM